MAKRRALGEHTRLETVQIPAPSAKTTKARRPPAVAERAPVERSIRATFNLPVALLEEARDTVIGLTWRAPGSSARLTLSELVRMALREKLDQLQKAHHKGKPWPSRGKVPLVVGRPMKD